jgi:hypothetical protein
MGTDIYRMSDGYKYRGCFEILDISAGILTIGTTVLIIDPTQQGRRLPVIFLGINIPFYEGPGEQYPFTNIEGAQFAVVLANQHGWYLVNTEYGAGWLNPADDIEFLYAPG